MNPLDDDFVAAVMRFMREKGYDQHPVFTSEMAQDAAEFGRRWALEHGPGVGL